MSNARTKDGGYIYPIIINDGTQSVRDGENGAVCKLSVRNGNAVNISSEHY